MFKSNGRLTIEYARLSRDDDKRKYVSIQNQKSIMNRYAAEHGLTVDKVFEDDGWSGYTMDRPDFNELKHLIDENMVDVLLVKDLSRLGRHNANVLLFLERLEVHNVRLILIDDNYDSAVDSDEILGIKTWYNERYVKNSINFTLRMPASQRFELERIANKEDRTVTNLINMVLKKVYKGI